MSDTLTGATGRNYVAGEWRDADTGDTYEKRSPWRPSEVTGVYQASVPPTSTPRSPPRATPSPRGPRFPLPPARRSSIGRRTPSTPARSRSPPT